MDKLKFPLKMNLQTFAAPEDEDETFDDEGLSLEGDPVGDEDTDDEPKTKKTPPPLNLNTAAWENVVELMKTQNAKMQEGLSGISPSLARMDELAAQINGSVNKLEETLSSFVAAITPPDVPPADVPPITTPEPEKKKSGLSWKKH